MKLNYKTKENETVSLEINAEELADLTSIIVEFGQTFKESELSLEDFFKELINPSTDEGKTKDGIHEKIMNSPKVKVEDIMNPPVKDLVGCRSTKSRVCPERQAFIKHWLKGNKIEFEVDKNSFGEDILAYSLTGDQVVELMNFLDSNECETSCYI